MGVELSIDWGNLDRMFGAMNTVGDQASEVAFYFSESVCSGAGFDYPTCALKPIGDQMPMIDGWFWDAHNYFQERWRDLTDAVALSAREIDARDGEVSEVFINYRGGYGPHGSPPPVAKADLELFQIEPITDFLAEPEPGNAELNHNNKFDAAATGWETAANTINWGIDILNGFGAGIDTIETDLRAYIVYPLSGDYAKIRANANACTNVDKAMENWGSNFSRMSYKVTTALTGESSLGFVAQLELYDVVMRLIGAGIGKGRVVFDRIAQVSEKIAVEVEDVLVILGEKLAKLATKIGSRFVPGAGWALLVWDILTKGLGVVQDIIDDIALVKEIIEDCFSLVEEIEAWAQTQAERLEKFQELLDIMQDLPLVGEGGGLDSVSGAVQPIIDRLSGIETDFGADTNEEGDDLDGALTDLGEDESLDEDLSEPPLDDDEIILAPGLPDGHPDAPSDDYTTA
jgi:hypothetical protein